MRYRISWSEPSGLSGLGGDYYESEEATYSDRGVAISHYRSLKEDPRNRDVRIFEETELLI